MLGAALPTPHAAHDLLAKGVLTGGTAETQTIGGRAPGLGHEPLHLRCFVRGQIEHAFPKSDKQTVLRQLVSAGRDLFH